MPIVIRVAIVVLSAYAGSALASVQFADLPEPSQMLQKWLNANTPHRTTAENNSRAHRLVCQSLNSFGANDVA
jgi:hypothetical protein